MLQRCLQCRYLIYYPRMLCPRCFSTDYAWEQLSGDGTVYSFSIVWRPNHPAFAEHIPITLAVVDLREGPQMVATLDSPRRRRPHRHGSSRRLRHSSSGDRTS